MNLSKCLLICLILTLIAEICEAEIIKESTSYSSRSRIAENNLIEGSSGRMNPSSYNSGKTRAVRPQRPNVAPIRSEYPARFDSWRFQAPEATSWPKPQSSQPQRELIFVSRCNMRERSGAAGSNSRRRHSRRRHHHGHNSERTQAPRVQRPTELSIRPEFTTESSSRYRNCENFARSGLQSSSSQQEQIFVSPPRHTRTKPDTAEDKPRKGHSRKIHHHKKYSGKHQPSRKRRPNINPIRAEFTTESPPSVVIQIVLE